jgi:hypothetical protein
MRKNQQLRHMAIALGASIVLNSLLIAIAFLTDPARFPSSRMGKIVDTLGRPGGAFTEWLLPGHDAPQVALIVVSSVVFYAVLIWVIVSLPTWWRHRA